MHLNAAGAALLSQSTLDVMTGHLRLEAEVGGYEAAEAAQDPIGNTYAAIAELVGGRSDEVALFDNATHAWNAAFDSLPLGHGDRLLTGRAEYGTEDRGVHPLVRLSPHYYNTEEDLDRAAQAVAATTT